MDKREFLKTVTAASVGMPILGAETRRFGVPGSITGQVAEMPQIRLPIANAGLPAAAWHDLERVVAGVSQLFNDSDSQAAFAQSPRAYLRSVGVGEDLLKTDDHEFKVLRVGLDPGVRSAVAAGDFQPFFERLATVGLMSGNTSGLTQRIVELIQKDSAGLAALKARFAENSEALPEDAMLIGNTLLAGPGVRAKSVEVSSEALVATHVVAATVAVATVYTLAMAVVAVAVVIVSEKATALGLGDDLSRLDTTFAEEYANAMQAARLFGVKELESATYRKMIEAQVTAILDAAESTGILALHGVNGVATRKAVLEKTVQTLGLA